MERFQPLPQRIICMAQTIGALLSNKNLITIQTNYSIIYFHFSTITKLLSLYTNKTGSVNSMSHKTIASTISNQLKYSLSSLFALIYSFTSLSQSWIICTVFFTEVYQSTHNSDDRSYLQITYVHFKLVFQDVFLLYNFLSNLIFSLGA